MNKYKILHNLSNKYKYCLNLKTNDEDLIAFDPLIKFTGYFDRLKVELLNDAGESCFNLIVNEFGSNIIECVPNYPLDFQFKNSATCLRDILKLIESNFSIQKYTGVYGAFKYESVEIFEDLGKKPESELFTFFLYDSFIDCKNFEVLSPRNHKLKITDAANQKLDVKFNNSKIKHSKNEYIKLVETVKSEFEQGNAFETVIRNELTSSYVGDEVALYELYATNISTPYQYYYDFGEEKLIGCSPELFIKISREGAVEIHPISGTVKRSDDVIEDHENLMYLLNSKKEKAELDMLIDLARNDLARFCIPGVKVTEYRTVQKLPYVYHTYAVVKGQKEAEVHPLDGVFSCFNAGTLTGAPKIEAMKIIKELENSPRNFYGGCNGFYRFNGDCEFVITIRSLEVNAKSKTFSYKAGATLLYESDPEKEYEETLNKMSGFINLMKI